MLEADVVEPVDNDENRRGDRDEGAFRRFLNCLDRRFEIKARESTFSTEIFGGITTFLSMAYVLTTNSTILASSNPDFFQNLWNSVFFATAVVSILGTLLMGLLPNMPFAQAPGMGLNAQTMLFMVNSPYYSYGGVMCVILLSGILFLLLTLTGFREYIFKGIPEGIKAAIPVGIGLFIAFIGMEQAHLIVDSNTTTLVQLVPFREMYSNKEVQPLAFSGIVCILGVIIIAILDRYNVQGAILLGVIASTFIAMPFGLVEFGKLKDGWNVGLRLKSFFSFRLENGGIFGQCFPGFENAFSSERIIATIVNIIAYGMVDLFDTLGSLHGLAVHAGLLDDNGRMQQFGRILFADCSGAVLGAIFGTSSVTTYVESGTGISVGAKTGFSSVVVALLFFLAIFLSPIFSLIPPCATSPALIYVGVLMMSTMRFIHFDNAIEIPAIFLTITMMPFAYSITNGIGFGILAYCGVALLSFVCDLIYYLFTKRIPDAAKGVDEKGNEIVRPQWPISLGCGVMAVLFLVMFLVPTHYQTETD